MNITKVIILSFGMSAIFFATSRISLKISSPPSTSMEEADDYDDLRPKEAKTAKSRTRSPASTNSYKADQNSSFINRSKNINNAQMNAQTLSTDDLDNFQDNPSIPSSKPTETISAGSQSFSTSNNNNDDDVKILPEQNKQADNVTASSQNTNAFVISDQALPLSPTITNEKEERFNGVSLSCSTTEGSGTYSTPISVGILCSSGSKISYCVGLSGSCCDPSIGSTYSSPLSMGSAAGTYCLTYEALSSTGKTFFEQKIFTFTDSTPDIQVTSEKLQYQTTEIPALTVVSSNDFGKDGHSMGIINLKSHNPGISGLNLSCEEIVTNYSTLTTPTPVVAMAETSITGFMPGTQIDAFIGLSSLNYGGNYITNYVVNYQNALPTYACSTIEKILWDFSYFDSFPLHGEVGSNTVRTFAGGFTSWGFFEPSSTVYRGPAGENVSNNGPEQLENGLFGIIY